MKKIILLIILLLLVGLVYFVIFKLNKPIISQPSANINVNTSLPAVNEQTNINVQPANPAPNILEPISSALSRVTKKPFGIYITAQNSPVSPERFSGYHIGVDFETTVEEQNIDVPIYAICDGSLALKKYATGYGGVAVQSCQIDGSDVTVVYGHLRLNSITGEVGQEFKAGDKIAVLGKGYSTETDGERKHLHLGIHKGKDINLLGYVQKTDELTNWLDVTTFLK